MYSYDKNISNIMLQYATFLPVLSLYIQYPILFQPVSLCSEAIGNVYQYWMFLQRLVLKYRAKIKVHSCFLCATEMKYLFCY